MSRGVFILVLAALALSGCNRAIVPATALTPDGKPALSRPPTSMMTPNGY